MKETLKLMSCDIVTQTISFTIFQAFFGLISAIIVGAPFLGNSILLPS